MDTRSLVHRGECADSNMFQCDSFTKLMSLGSVGVGGGLFIVFCKKVSSIFCFSLHESKLVHVGKGEHISACNEE